MRKSNSPFHKWVSKPLGIFIFFLMFFPILFINGAYTSNIGDMVSGLGIMTEHIQFSSFATAVGMAVFTPLTIRYLEIQRPKAEYLIGLSLLALFSFFCAKTTSIPLLIFCSFFTGFVRMILIFNTLFSLLGYISGKDMLSAIKPSPIPVSPDVEDKMDRVKAQGLPFLYLFFLTIGQLGSFFTAWLAYEYEWQYVYYFMIGLVLTSLIIVETTMIYQKRLITSKLSFTKFADFVTASLVLLSFCFILIYGKTFDWFDSLYIRVAFIIFLLSTGIFLLLQINTKKHPYMDFKILASKNAIIALLVFLLGMILNSSSMLVSTFTSISMSLDNWQNAILNNYSLVGYVIGAIIACLMSKWNMHFKYIFAFSFLCITLSAVYMYFQYQSMGLYNNLIFPIILRSVGMIIFYAMAGVWGMRKLNMVFVTSWIFLMLAFRSVIGPVVGSAIYSNVMNKKQQYYITSLSENVDMMNPEAANIFSQTQMGAMMQGKSYENAQILATRSAKGRVQVQAMLSSLKEIAGWTIFFGAGCIVIVLIIPYKQKKE